VCAKRVRLAPNAESAGIRAFNPGQVEGKVMLIIESAGLTDRGLKRSANEDAFLVDDDHRLYAVADGMGGHRAGEVASAAMIETLVRYFDQSEPPSNRSTTAAPHASPHLDSKRLMMGIQLGNQVVHELSCKHDAYRGMGSTIAVVYAGSDRLIAANVGDSPIYRIRDNDIEQISMPHTLMAEQTRLDPDGDAPLGTAFRHVLTRAIGVEATVKVDLRELQSASGDILVIGSDGLSDKVSPPEIRDVVTEQRPKPACRRMIDLANQRGGDDNITVVVLKFTHQAIQDASPLRSLWDRARKRIIK
jgi:protein phosphatase